MIREPGREDDAHGLSARISAAHGRYPFRANEKRHRNPARTASAGVSAPFPDHDWQLGLLMRAILKVARVESRVLGPKPRGISEVASRYDGFTVPGRGDVRNGVDRGGNRE